MKKILLVLFVCFAMTPSSADAYRTYSQTAQQINETTTIYSIEYKFGHGSWDFYLPVQAVRNEGFRLAGKQVSFEVLEDGKRPIDVGTVQSIVVSDAPIIDGLYKVPKGTVETFTLYVILTTDEDTPEADYAIHVTDLPFYRGDDREKLQLNSSELESYITPEVEFNESNPSK